MTNFEKEIMELLKNNFLRSDENYRKNRNKAKREIRFQRDDKEGSYYLFSLADNLYKPMSNKTLLEYGSGSGNEIFSGKMNALRSSSALTYNLFGNEYVILDGKKFSVEFEKQFHTLKTSVSSFPANLDAFLYCEETQEAIACEMKMLEWLLNNPGKLKKAYLNPKNYIDENAGNTFKKIAAKYLIENYDETLDLEEYSCKYDRYDAFQMFKHAIACYTDCATEEEKRPIKKLTLLNCIWTLSNPDKLSDKASEEYAKRKKEEMDNAKKFAKLMNENSELKNLFNEEGIKVEFSVEFCEFGNLLSRLDKTEDELSYLKRYTL